MRIIMLGAPGAGKGSVSKYLCAKKGIVQISTGDILRQEIQAKSEIGLVADGYIKNGNLVPDEVVLAIVEKRISQPDCLKGFIFDGFPRTIPQAESLKAILAKMGIKIDLVADIVVPEEVIYERLTTRRTCSNPKCQAIYNTKHNPPKVEGICNLCGSPVVIRSDETREAIEQRLKTYAEKTSPLTEYYKNEGLLYSVSGVQTIEEIGEEIASKVNA